MIVEKGMQVEHPEFGPGTVQEVLGGTAVINFFGEEIDVEVDELIVIKGYEAAVPTGDKPSGTDKVEFRRAYEAVNLGVVPPDPNMLISMTIGGSRITKQVRSWLAGADNVGLCKVIFGYYGSGKSHYLHVVSSIARNAGWVVAFLEFDPKAADPAKPHLVYRGLMSNLRFPKREDGSIANGFMGLIKEIRGKWDYVRDRPLFKASPWFKNAVETLLYYPHGEDQDYASGCEWLGGQAVNVSEIRRLARGAGKRPKTIPLMPRIKETSDIYVYHLVVVNEICRALGYKGLIIILDEAEHVRGFNVHRTERANNFFDLLARAAHLPLPVYKLPTLNDFGHDLPEFWKTGPHFGLFVGLTEDDIFSDMSLSLRDACVFLHSEEDRLRLTPPLPEDYEQWCTRFYANFHGFYPEQTQLLSEEEKRRAISAVLRNEFESVREAERVLRTWVKLACLVPSILLARGVKSYEELVSTIKKAAKEASGEYLPWEF